jgi:hypothetical protein
MWLPDYPRRPVPCEVSLEYEPTRQTLGLDKLHRSTRAAGGSRYSVNSNYPG